MLIHVLPHPRATRRFDRRRRWLFAAVLNMLTFPTVAAVHAGDAVVNAGSPGGSHPVDRADAFLAPAKAADSVHLTHLRVTRPGGLLGLKDFLFSGGLSVRIAAPASVSGPNGLESQPAEQEMYADASDPTATGEVYADFTDAFASSAISDDDGFTGSNGARTASRIDTSPVPATVPVSIRSADGLSPQAAGQNLYVDASDPMVSGEVYAGPTYGLSSGAINYNDEYIGYNGAGTFSQTGGSNTVSLYLYLGSNVGSSGQYTLSGTGTLTAQYEYIGNVGTGTFTQSGGTNTADDLLYVGNASGNGTYNLSGTGTLTVPTEYIGSGSTGTFTQSGGSNTVSGSLNIGSSNGSGTYNLSGTGMLDAFTESIGPGGTGTFTQNGGDNTVTGSNGSILVGDNRGIGIYNLGYGIITTPSESIGGGGTGTFTQTGGSNLVSGPVTLGGAGGAGTYNLNGGTLATSGVALGSTLPFPGFNTATGTFNFNGGTLQATASSTTFMTGLTAANVLAGGAVIDSYGKAITIGQPLLHGVASGLDGGLSVQGMGTLTLTGISTFNGPTLVGGGTLVLNAGSSPALGNTSSVTTYAGRTLSLGAANQINPAATLALNGNSGPAAGATVAFNTGGYSQTLGALTLVSNSVIDLGSGASVLRLGSSMGKNWMGTLAVWNWTGTAITGGGADELFFGGNTSGLTEVQVLDIRFYSDAGTTLLGTAGFAASDDGEVVPDGVLPGTGVAVPEPATWFAGAASLSLMLLRRQDRDRRYGKWLH